MTDDFPRDRSANPAGTHDDLHEADPIVTPTDEETSARGPIATGPIPGADASLGGREDFAETGLEDRNVDLDPESDQPTSSDEAEPAT